MRVSKEKLEKGGAFAEGLGPEYDEYKERYAVGHLVDVFTGEALKSRLFDKVGEGKRGWDDPDSTDYDFESLISKSAGAGLWVDVAAYAMFAWNDEQEDEDTKLPKHKKGESFEGASVGPLSYDSEGREVRMIESEVETGGDNDGSQAEAVTES